MRTASWMLVALAVVVGCQQGPGKLDQMTTGHPGSGTAPAPKTVTVSTGSGSADASKWEDLDSKDILARTETTPEVQVKHVLIGWKDLADAYRGHMDPGAAKRDNAEAAALAKQIADKLRANPDSIDDLVKQYSEDPGSKRGDPYTVKADSQFVPEFKNLALRLKPKEVGIVRSAFGYHVMERVPPPPPDPLESAEVLARPVTPGTAYVQHMVVGWKDSLIGQQVPGSPAAARSKDDADKIAKDVVTKANAGDDFAKLMAEHSDEPGAKTKAPEPTEISDDMKVPDEFEKFKNLAVRLKVGEAGMVKTPFGWMVMKRVAPPPPDPLESADILKRDPQTAKAKVKHILLGWKEVHAGDPRGAKRTRAELESLVKDTVAKLQKGDKIEPLMASLSEDPGSAKSGESYDVTPDSQFVPPFKNLSLRLKVGEVGVVKSNFGLHIIKRIE
ncbi:MAG TPA: peptidylprolyl isomerase [Kofleriaceae bacterium]|nr:peptidylprolyl isomerase [Kofleriaceae bacterium]